MPVVIATLIPVPEYRHEVREALLEVIPAVQAEPGCEVYALHEGTDRFVMIEQWATGQSLANHGKAGPLTGLVEKLDGKLVEPLDVVVVEPVHAGDPDKGRLR